MSSFSVDALDEALSPFARAVLNRSRLYQAAVQLSRIPADNVTQRRQAVSAISSQLEKEAMAINTQDMDLILQQNQVSHLTFEQLQAMPLTGLSPKAKAFVVYLQQNPDVFNRLSALDQEPGTLSVADIRIAAQLAGDSLVVNEEDLAYLNDNNTPVSSPQPADASPAVPPPGQDTEPPAVTPFAQAMPLTVHTAASGQAIIQPGNIPPMTPTEVMGMMERLDAQRVNWNQLTPTELENLELSDPQRRMLRMLNTDAARSMLNRIQGDQRTLTVDMLRILFSLIWNPTVMTQSPVLFFRQELYHPDTDETEEEKTGYLPLPPIGSVRKIGQENGRRVMPGYRGRKRVEWHAGELKALLHAINPGTDHVTLSQLRAYQPKNNAEARIIEQLCHVDVFQELAIQDRDARHISPEDIRIAVAEKTLILTDPYLTLVILPD